MQVLLNCQLAAFMWSCSDFKKESNDHLIMLSYTYVFAYAVSVNCELTAAYIIVKLSVYTVVYEIVFVKFQWIAANFM